MADELKEALDFLGFESIAQLKEQFPKKYFTKSQVYENKELLGEFTGKTLKKIKDTVLKGYREKDVPFTHNEFEDVPLEEVVITMHSRQEEKYAPIINDLKSQIGKTGEEAVKPYLEKISKFEQSLLDEQKAKKEIANQFDQFKQEAEGRIQSTRIDYFKKDLMTSIDYDPMIMKDDLKRKGWESHVSENYKFGFDEHDQPVIMDKTGSKIKNPKKADEWLTPKDVLSSEAERLGLTKKNQQGGNPAPKFQPQTQQRPQTAFTPQAPTDQAPPVKRNRLAPGMDQYRSQ